MVWVIPFCSPVAELNRWLGTWKLSGVDRSAQTKQVHINSHAYTCIHHPIQLAVGDMTMSGWKPTISLIHTPPPPNRMQFTSYSIHINGVCLDVSVMIDWCNHLCRLFLALLSVVYFSHYYLLIDVLPLLKMMVFYRDMLLSPCPERPGSAPQPQLMSTQNKVVQILYILQLRYPVSPNVTFVSFSDHKCFFLFQSLLPVFISLVLTNV